MTARPAPDGAARGRALRVAIWLVAATLLFNLLFGDMGVIQGLRQRRASSRLQAEVARLEAENAALAADIKALHDDPFRIEAIAREELGLARPGEIVFLFTPDPGSAPPSAAARAADPAAARR